MRQRWSYFWLWFPCGSRFPSEINETSDFLYFSWFQWTNYKKITQQNIWYLFVSYCFTHYFMTVWLYSETSTSLLLRFKSINKHIWTACVSTRNRMNVWCVFLLGLNNDCARLPQQLVQLDESAIQSESFIFRSFLQYKHLVHAPRTKQLCVYAVRNIKFMK